MGIGAKVRRLFGPHERAIAAAYRRCFVDLDSFAANLLRLVPHARTILEIGCGEGQMTERLARIYPQANICAIDLAPEPGRLYRGDARRVAFSSTSLEVVAAEQSRSFDMVLMVDVLHHVPIPMRTQLLRLAGSTVAPSGVFVLKDWARLPTFSYLVGYLADRFITGDKVAYHSPPELREAACVVFDHPLVISEWTVSPWSSNMCFLVRSAESGYGKSLTR